MAGVEKDFEELLRLFNKHKVRYCIVGAFALGFHALPRYTKDLDLFVESSKENGEKIARALEEFGFGSLGVIVEDLAHPGKIIQLGYEPIRIDLTTFIEGVSFEKVWKNRVRGKLGKVSVPFIGVAEFIKNKRKSGRHQDLADLEVIEKVRKKSRLARRRK